MRTIKIKPVVCLWKCKSENCRVSEQTAVVWTCAPSCLNCGSEMEYAGIIELLEIELPVTLECD
jgi:hypothetical protein